MNITEKTAHHVKNAYRYSLEELWLVVGGTDPWPDDLVPPNPVDTPLVTDVNTIVGAKKAASIMVVNDETLGTEEILLNDVITKWRILSNLTEALSENSNYCLSSATIIGDELPLTTIREIGLYTGLQHTQSNLATTLLPADITDLGQCEVIQYRVPITRDDVTNYKFSVLLEF